MRYRNVLRRERHSVPKRPALLHLGVQMEGTYYTDDNYRGCVKQPGLATSFQLVRLVGSGIYRTEIATRYRKHQAVCQR